MAQLSQLPYKKTPRWLLVSIFVLILVVVGSSIWDITSTTAFGENDFVGYWSATYLFHNGQNPYDQNLMEVTQSTKLETSQNATIMAWNPPPLFVFLLPLASLSFLQAKFVWLIISLLIIITASMMLVEIYYPQKNSKFVIVSMLFVLLFPPVVSGLYMGQVTFLVFFGLVSSMYLMKNEMWFWAGAALILTTIKPHLVILSLIYMLIYMAQQRKFQGWGGLLVAGLICIIILFLYRPEWINDFIGLSRNAPISWATPTIGGILSSAGITESARYLILIFLPLPIFLTWQNTKFSMEFSVALLTLITVPVTFFGWNYDQSMLLIPIILIFSWLAQSETSLQRTFSILLITLSLAVNIYLRTLSTNDVFFVWIPLSWWLIFLVTWYNSTHRKIIL